MSAQDQEGMPGWVKVRCGLALGQDLPPAPPGSHPPGTLSPAAPASAPAGWAWCVLAQGLGLAALPGAHGCFATGFLGSGTIQSYFGN